MLTFPHHFSLYRFTSFFLLLPCLFLLCWKYLEFLFSTLKCRNGGSRSTPVMLTRYSYFPSSLVFSFSFSFICFSSSKKFTKRCSFLMRYSDDFGARFAVTLALSPPSSTKYSGSRSFHFFFSFFPSGFARWLTSLSLFCSIRCSLLLDPILWHLDFSFRDL